MVDVYLGPLLDDGLQFQVHSSCSVQCGVSSLLYVNYDTTLSQLSFIAVCTEFQVRGSPPSQSHAQLLITSVLSTFVHGDLEFQACST